MANSLQLPRTANLPDCGGTTPCDPAPACPACGGLQCLCRPRFFAGQLLTEDDLNRLDDYIVQKNRLHNRHLVGTGVACGLEVVCTVCEPASRGTVVVRPGYAVSPCGNDIVVCHDQTVDICALITRCRPNVDLCLSPTNTSDDCGGATEDWILGICYAEKPSRGVTALLNAADPARASCGCNGGGCSCGKKSSGGGGCGCSGSQSTSTKPRASAKPVPPQCEPTLTCESYSFTVWKAPTVDRTKQVWGAAAKRFVCCIQPYLSALGQARSDTMTVNWYNNLRETIREFIVNSGFYDCTIAAKLAAATPPADGTSEIVSRAAIDLIVVASIFIQKCLCSALLPPCPDTAPSDCVPIATITVKRRPCEVTKICNLSARKFLMTAPNIEYWASFFNLFPTGSLNSLRAALERACCTDLSKATIDRATFPANAEVGSAHLQNLQQDAAQASGGASGQLLWDALRQTDRAVNATTLLFGAMGGLSNGKPAVSGLELANPADFLLLNQIAAPMLRALAPFDVTPSSTSSSTEAARDTQIEDLKKQVDTLQQTVNTLVAQNQ